ncbi:MAG: hypothetical protein OEV28_14285, partial [Nitrospirota bacterium]|nr:hypothetical protein [Nitrospirota bacterium]
MTSTMFKSIKLKLVIWFLVVFSVVFTGLEIYLYYKLEGVVLNLVDDHLESSIESLSNLIALEESHGQIEKELQELSITATGPYIERLSGHYYQVTNTEGEVIVTSPSLGLADAFLPSRKGVVLEPRFETIVGPNGEDLRLITKSVRYDIGYLTFQGADNLETTYKLVVSFRSIILFIFPAVFILCGVGVFIMTGVALKSLRIFSDKVGEITAESLSDRIENEKIPLELKPLASNFNTMLERLEKSFGRQKQFLSDASHELRTPTSIIKSYCDVTLSKQRSAAEYAEILAKVADTVNRMCDIINRILVISRLDTKTIHFQPEKMDV